MKNNKNLVLACALAFIIAISACTPIDYNTGQEKATYTCPDGTILNCPEPVVNSTGDVNETQGTNETTPVGDVDGGEPEDSNVTEEQPVEVPDEEPAEQPDEPELSGEPDVTAVEGELVELDTTAVDPDGDELTLTYSEPFNEDGTWQTDIGDAGRYEVTVTASDGIENVSKRILIQVLPQNNPPAIEMADTVEVTEGRTVTLEPKVSDADDDDVEVTFSGWMESAERETGYDDAGTYKVTVSATDGKATTTKDVTVTVLNRNRKPSLKVLNSEQGQITVEEGQTALIETRVSDADRDSVEVTFSEPFDDDGRWSTEAGDEGEYIIAVTATDGVDTVSQEILVVVVPQNKAPMLSPIEDMYVSVPVGETATVTLSPQVTDPEGDEFTVTYSGWMTESSRTVEWGKEGGTHVVTVTATDASGASASIDVNVRVNSEPCFVGDCPQTE